MSFSQKPRPRLGIWIQKKCFKCFSPLLLMLYNIHFFNLAHYRRGNFRIFPKGGRSSTTEVPGLRWFDYVEFMLDLVSYNIQSVWLLKLRACFIVSIFGKAISCSCDQFELFIILSPLSMLHRSRQKHGQSFIRGSKVSSSSSQNLQRNSVL